MEHHVYAGKHEDEVFSLFTDGRPEPGGPFGWGRTRGPAVTATAIRMLSREIPATVLQSYLQKFEETVLRELPGSWTITSDQIREWMHAGKLE